MEGGLPEPQWPIADAVGPRGPSAGPGECTGLGIILKMICIYTGCARLHVMRRGLENTCVCHLIDWD